MEELKVEIHKIGNIDIAELPSKEYVINTADDVSDLVGNLYYNNVDRIILYHHQLTERFFDLKTGLAGEILQKFSNYRFRLAIVGDFSSYSSTSLQDFIRESNTRRQVNFVASKELAIEILADR